MFSEEAFGFVAVLDHGAVASFVASVLERSLGELLFPRRTVPQLDNVPIAIAAATALKSRDFIQVGRGS